MAKSVILKHFKPQYALEDLETALINLVNDGELYLPKPGRYKPL